MKTLPLVLLAGSLAIADDQVPSFRTISTLHSKVYAGARALADCEQDAGSVHRSFPAAAAAAAEIRLLDVQCQPVSGGRYRLAFVYEHDMGNELETLAQGYSSAELCASMLTPIRGRFDQVGLASVFAHCSAGTLFVDFIAPLAISTGRFDDSPAFADAQSCQLRLGRLERDFGAGGLSPLMGGCHSHESLTEAGKRYYVTTLTYAMELGKTVTRLHARRAKTLADCESDFAGLRDRFSAAALPVVDAFCVQDSLGFHQVMSFVDKLISRINAYESALLASAASCEQSRGRVESSLTGRGNRLLHSYCEESLSWRGETEGYRFRIHYVRPE
jgi:hypothetical protein